jgi:two-component system sensor histidine kinase TctE
VLAVATLVWFAVRLVLQPLMRLKHEVETAALSDLSDVDPALVHKEVRPLVEAMNGTMSRMQSLMSQPAPLHRRRVAPVAHAADRAQDAGRDGAARDRRPARHARDRASDRA